MCGGRPRFCVRRRPMAAILLHRPEGAEVVPGHRRRLLGLDLTHHLPLEVRACDLRRACGVHLEAPPMLAEPRALELVQGVAGELLQLSRRQEDGGAHAKSRTWALA